MAQADDYDSREDLGWFRDQLRERDRLIAELRQTDLIRRLREHAEDYTASIESWCEAFGMELTADGWSWAPFWDARNALIDRYNEVVKRWNRAVPILNASTQPVGRPLAASEAQVAQVISWHKYGLSVRGIADEMSLSLQTVRTILIEPVRSAARRSRSTSTSARTGRPRSEPATPCRSGFRPSSRPATR